MSDVLDSCVALKWVLPEADTDEAVKLREAHRVCTLDLCAPDLFPLEVAHSLARAERRGIILPGEGALKLIDVLLHVPRLQPALPLLPRAFELAGQARIGVYDCLYVALAEREGGRLITADERLARSLPTAPIVLLSSLP